MSPQSSLRKLYKPSVSDQNIEYERPEKIIG